MGIEGAAVATLISFSVNGLLILHFLKHYITIRIETAPILHILMSVIPMVIFILVYLSFIPLDNVIVTLIPVGIGGMIYGIFLLRLDRSIHDELFILARQFGLPWPKWL
jgi:O-antigen/teichoic acid export membrane protein